MNSLALVKGMLQLVVQFKKNCKNDRIIQVNYLLNKELPDGPEKIIILWNFFSIQISFLTFALPFYRMEKQCV